MNVKYIPILVKKERKTPKFLLILVNHFFTGMLPLVKP